MRDLAPDLAASLAAGVTTLARVWRVARADGAVFGFTDHDRTLDFDGLVCEPADGVAMGAVEKGLGLGADTTSLSGALASGAITEEDLARGLWDGARVDLYLVDWTAPGFFAHLFAGRMGEVRRGAQAFEAEVRGLQAGLDVAVGRVFSHFCDADVGDARCQVDLEDPAFRGEGAVEEILGVRAFRASGVDGFADGWFARGRLSWDAGGSSEVGAHRAGAAGAIIELIDPPGPALELGASFVVTAGCDKRHETCHAKFANIVNFRGFPRMPGNDAVQAGPIEGDVKDGSSRWS